MIWAILIALGVPLWLCALGISAFILRNRGLRKRPGNIPVRVLRHGKKRWARGHAIWVHDVFAFRGSPAAWKEALVYVDRASLREPTKEERDGWHQLGDQPVVATLGLEGAGAIEVAARDEHRHLLLGPFAEHARRDCPAAPVPG